MRLVTVRKYKQYRKNKYDYIVTLKYQGRPPKTTWIKADFKSKRLFDPRTTPITYSRYWKFGSKTEANRIAKKIKELK